MIVSLCPLSTSFFTLHAGGVVEVAGFQGGGAIFIRLLPERVQLIAVVPVIMAGGGLPAHIAVGVVAVVKFQAATANHIQSVIFCMGLQFLCKAATISLGLGLVPEYFQVPGFVICIFTGVAPGIFWVFG